jgi:spore maturation protein CgeB
MPARIRHYLESPQEARAIAEAGYALVTQEVTFRASVERILTHCPH